MNLEDRSLQKCQTLHIPVRILNYLYYLCWIFSYILSWIHDNINICVCMNTFWRHLLQSLICKGTSYVVLAPQMPCSFIHFWHAPLAMHSAKCRRQSPEWMIMSYANCFIQGGLLDFRSCWIVLIHVVLVVSSISPRGKLLRSSWHLFHPVSAQCGCTGRNAVLGQ